ncbi:MAG: acyl-CoA thioesterase [Oleiphilaceae bacterium]|nr:acyl-CoA thioesterase [Oleiphilaceae bacterium]
MSSLGQRVHTQTMPLRWGDMDAFGHANNTVYFRFFEEARITWFASLELGGQDDSTGPVIIKTSATFLKEMAYPVTVQVDLFIGKAGNTSLEHRYTITDTQTGTLYAEGDAKLVWFDRRTRKSSPLPEQLRALASP